MPISENCFDIISKFNVWNTQFQNFRCLCSVFSKTRLRPELRRVLSYKLPVVSLHFPLEEKGPWDPFYQLQQVLSKGRHLGTSNLAESTAYDKNCWFYERAKLSYFTFKNGQETGTEFIALWRQFVCSGLFTPCHWGEIQRLRKSQVILNQIVSPIHREFLTKIFWRKIRRMLKNL